MTQHTENVLTASSNGASKQAHDGLRRNLGMPRWLTDQLLVTGSLTRNIIDTISPLVLPIENAVVSLLAKIPTKLKHAVIMAAWCFWMCIHRFLPRKVVQRGISDSLSLEAHALGTVIWLTRLFPVTVGRARMGLSELASLYLLPDGIKKDRINDTERGVRGIYLHTAPETSEDAPVLFWVFGGAYVGGDAECNCGFAARFAQQLGCDSFLPDHRLYPEAKIEDAYTDVCRAYEWLMERKNPKKVIVFGISSGGGVALRVLQLAKASAAERRGFFFGDAAPPQPAGAALVGPFVNYTFGEGADAGTDGLPRNHDIDWLVQTRLVEWMVPRAGDLCGGDEKRRSTSPLFQSMDGLCPTCVSVSEHEACLDQCMALEQRLKAAGNQVQLYTRPYLCHAYQMFPVFLPEAQAEEAQLVAWMKQRLL